MRDLTRRMWFYTSEELYIAIRAMAHKLGISPSTLIRMGVELIMKEIEKGEELEELM